MTPAERMHDLLEEVELADRVGLDVFSVGGHHRPDYIVSAPSTLGEPRWSEGAGRRAAARPWRITLR